MFGPNPYSNIVLRLMSQIPVDGLWNACLANLEAGDTNTKAVPLRLSGNAYEDEPGHADRCGRRPTA